MYDGGGENAAYVRCTMYDVRLPNSRALRGGAEPRRGVCMKLCAELGVAFVVASLVGLCYNPAAPAKANALKNAFAMYDLRCTMYDLLIMCALRRFFSDH